MSRRSAHDEVTAPVWEAAALAAVAEVPPDLPSGPLAFEGRAPIDRVLEEPAVVVGAAALLGLAGSALSAVLGFLLGVLVG